MREADRYTIEELGIPGVVLMENAGIAVVRALNEAFPPEDQRKILVFCGKGNNGGDGFVVARHMFLSGDDVEVLLAGAKKELKGDASLNMNIAERLGIPITEIGKIADLENLNILLDDFDIIIDALLGTGIQKPAEDLYAYIIELINSTGSFVVSVDIPSGLPTDSGELIGPAVEADLTVTFGYPKICHVMPPAEDQCRELVVADICIPDEAVKFEKGSREIITAESLEDIIQPRLADSHKGDYGHLLVVAGSMGKIGASVMAARSASCSGAGLVTVAAPLSCVPVVQAKLTEEMAFALEDNGKGFILKENVANFPLEGKFTAYAVGPGIGNKEETFAFIRSLLPLIPVPAVLDADGLNAIAGQLEILRDVKVPLILTPHPGEFARLTGMDVAEVQKNRLEAAADFSMKWKVYIVLKGYRTVVASPEGNIYVNLTGNPGMAKGGSGDVLTGIIGGLLAAGIEPLDAARLGVYLHGLAGDIAAEELPETVLSAVDIIEALPDVFETL